VRRFNALGRDPNGQRPGDARFALTLFGVLRDRRFRYESVAELDGVGPVAFAIVSNCEIFTYVGSRPMSLTPRARFELGLDAVAGCGGAHRSIFSYDRSKPVDLRDQGVVNKHYPIAIHDVSYASPPCQGDGEAGDLCKSAGGRVPAYLVVPPGKGPFPAVIY